MIKSTPAVSVVVAAYNYARYLPMAVDSILAQTYRDFEIIVVDDGSTDNTQAVVLPYINANAIRYFRQINSGQAVAKNMGIKESRGEYVAFLDADDIWFPAKLEKQMPLFSKAEIGVVYSKRVLIDKNHNESPFSHPKLYRGRVLDHIFIDNFVGFSSAVVRKKCFDKVGIFDESLPMAIDYDLWLRIALHYEFDFVDEPLFKYRVGHGHMSENKDRRFECAWRVMNEYFDNPDLRKKLSWWVPYYAKAHTYGNMGNHNISKDRKKAMQYFMISLFHDPLYLYSWKGLVRCFLP